MTEATASHDHDTDHTHAVSFGKGVQDSLRKPAVDLRRAIPQVYDGYRQLHGAAFAEGAVTKKHKELIALAIAVRAQCDGCIASHARGAAKQGATEDEVAETLGVCISMMGGPGTVYAPRAFAAFREFSQALQ
jgi:AhpD family alkylhydroperoxidase